MQDYRQQWGWQRGQSVVLTGFDWWKWIQTNHNPYNFSLLCNAFLSFTTSVKHFVTCFCISSAHEMVWFVYAREWPVLVCEALGSWAESLAPHFRWHPSASPAALLGRCPPPCHSLPWWCRLHGADLVGRSCHHGGSWQSPARRSPLEMSLPTHIDSPNIIMTFCKS